MKNIFGDKKEDFKRKIEAYIQEKFEGFKPEVEFSEEGEEKPVTFSISNTEDTRHDEFWDKYEEVFPDIENGDELTDLVIAEIYKNDIGNLGEVVAMYSGDNVLIHAY